MAELTKQRKELVAGGFKDKHFNWGSLLLGLGVAIAVEGACHVEDYGAPAARELLSLRSTAACVIPCRPDQHIHPHRQALPGPSPVRWSCHHRSLGAQWRRVRLARDEHRERLADEGKFPLPLVRTVFAVATQAAAAAMVPAMQKGNDTARSVHIGLNCLNLALFAWQARIVAALHCRCDAAVPWASCCSKSTPLCCSWLSASYVPPRIVICAGAHWY